ncbi:MAG: hypothetical protein JKY67_11575 [Pseudomonadales bacterium]|nr:hypothetical protein [Pseudomonadales bacterium]
MTSNKSIRNCVRAVMENKYRHPFAYQFRSIIINGLATKAIDLVHGYKVVIECDEMLNVRYSYAA